MLNLHRIQPLFRVALQDTAFHLHWGPSSSVLLSLQGMLLVPAVIRLPSYSSRSYSSCSFWVALPSTGKRKKIARPINAANVSVNLLTTKNNLLGFSDNFPLVISCRQIHAVGFVFVFCFIPVLRVTTSLHQSIQH